MPSSIISSELASNLSDIFVVVYCFLDFFFEEFQESIFVFKFGGYLCILTTSILKSF
jgi:hypothetical protein